ncbi:hypothetical protein R1sor_003988 [Riccia sorocarpa]|uniref:Uncharacterized protein n=1 Tax=Riccia sorocarpa TaxID=122646 RepID=A0ABD3H5C9_9MARC
MLTPDLHFLRADSEEFVTISACLNISGEKSRSFYTLTAAESVIREEGMTKAYLRGGERRGERKRRMAEEEEDDDHVTLQECLDRQKFSFVRNKRKIFAPNPLHDEENPTRRNVSRKRSKRILELLGVDSPCPQSFPRSKPDKYVSEKGAGAFTEGKKKKRKNRKRSRDGDGFDKRPVHQGEEFLNSFSENAENLTTSESTRKFFIHVAKVELSQGRRLSSGSAADDLEASPRTTSPRGLEYRDESFLPGEGYHTCEDAENCQRTPCLEKVLDHLDRMSEEQLKLWYKAIMGEVFCSRNGEKVRGRLRRMIRCRVKEIMKDQSSGSAVSSPSWRSSSTAELASPSVKSAPTGECFNHSPGSKMSASNAGDGTAEIEGAGTPTSKIASPAIVSSAVEVSRELTFKLPTSRNSCSTETSTISSVDDPEPPLPVVTPRITRSKARDLVKKSSTEELDGTLSVAPAAEETESAGTADFHYLPSPSTKDSGRESVSTEELCKDGMQKAVDESFAADATTHVIPEKIPSSAETAGDPVQYEVACASPVSTRSRKKSCSGEKLRWEPILSANHDAPDARFETAVVETTVPATRSKKKKDVVAADCNVTSQVADDAGAIEITTTTSVRFRRGGNPEKLVTKVALSTDSGENEHQGGGGLVRVPSAAIARSRKRREFLVLEKSVGPSPYDWDEDDALPVERNFALGSCLARSPKKSATQKDGPSADCNLSGPPQCGDSETAAVAIRPRKRRDGTTFERFFSEARSSTGVSLPSLEHAAADSTKPAGNSHKQNFAVEKDPGEVIAPDDCNVSGRMDELETPEKSKTASYSHCDGRSITGEQVPDDDPAPELFVGLIGEPEVAAKKVVTRSGRKSSVLEKGLGDSSTSTISSAVFSDDAGVEGLVTSGDAENIIADSLSETNARESTPVIETLSNVSPDANPSSFPLGKLRVEFSFPAPCIVNGVLVEVGGGTTAVAIRSAEKPADHVSLSASSEVKVSAAENGSLDTRRGDRSPCKKVEVPTSAEVTGEVSTPSHLARLSSPADGSMQNLTESETQDLMEKDVPSLTEVIKRLLSVYPSISSDSKDEDKSLDRQESEEPLIPTNSELSADGEKNFSTVPFAEYPCTTERVIIGCEDVGLAARPKMSLNYHPSPDDNAAECLNDLSPSSAALPLKEEASCGQHSEFSDLRSSESSGVFQSQPHGWGWICKLLGGKPPVCSVSSHSSDPAEASECTFNTQFEETPSENVDMCHLPLQSECSGNPEEAAAVTTDVSPQEGSHNLADSDHESDLSDLDAGDQVLFEQLISEKVSCIWPAREEMEMPPDACSKAAEICRRGSIKWQLGKCISTKAQESVPEPRVWRDAGDFLERLDSLYTMMETEGCFLLSPSRKRKHHETSIADDSFEFPRKMSCSDYGSPPRGYQIDALPTASAAVKVLPVRPGDAWPEEQQDQQLEEVKNGSTATAEFADSQYIEEPLSSQEHQECWDHDRNRKGETTVHDVQSAVENENSSHEICLEDSVAAGEILSPPMVPREEDSYLVDSLPCGSSDGSLEAAARLDACVDLLTCEQLIDGGHAEEFDQMTETLAAPHSLPPIRLKLPSGRSRHIASVVTEAELEPEKPQKARPEWREEVEGLDQEPRGTASVALSPNSSEEEDSADSLSRRDASVSVGVSSDGTPSHKMSLVYSPTSPEPSPKHNSCSNNEHQGRTSSPEIHAPQPAAARGASKGILKSSPKCEECVKLRLQARTASDFVASQMKTFGEVAGRLTREIQELRSIIESQGSFASERSTLDDTMQDTMKAISRSKDTEKSAEKNLGLLLRDCKRFCKLTAKRPQRRIVFADEAGKKLCHVKTFQSSSAPVVARPLWGVL